MTPVEKAAASLSDLERELVLGTSSGWGSWMWGVSSDLRAKGIMYAKSPTQRVLTPFGLQVKALIEGEKG